MEVTQYESGDAMMMAPKIVCIGFDQTSWTVAGYSSHAPTDTVWAL